MFSDPKQGWWIHLVVGGVVGLLANLLPQLAAAAPVDPQIQALLIVVANGLTSYIRHWGA